MTDPERITVYRCPECGWYQRSAFLCSGSRESPPHKRLEAGTEELHCLVLPSNEAEEREAVEKAWHAISATRPPRNGLPRLLRGGRGLKLEHG